MIHNSIKQHNDRKQLLKAAATGNRVSRKKIPSFVPLLKLSNQA